MSRSILFTNGNFYCGKSAFADSLFCCDKKIVKVGTYKEVKKAAKEAEKVDLNGRFAFPDFSGFIREVEFGCYEGGEEMLSLYDKKMARKVQEEKTDMYLREGDECTFATYDVDLLQNASQGKVPEMKQLIIDGELFYDEDSFAEEQWMWLMMQQYY